MGPRRRWRCGEAWALDSPPIARAISFLHGFAEFHPGRNPGAARLLVLAFGQPGDADRADELAVERQRYPAADEVNLVAVHVHDPEVTVGAGLVEVGELLGRLPVLRRGEGL